MATCPGEYGKTLLSTEIVGTEVLATFECLRCGQRQITRTEIRRPADRHTKQVDSRLVKTT